MQRDPLGRRKVEHHYLYASLDPSRFTDPTGEITWAGDIPSAFAKASDRASLEDDLRERIRKYVGGTSLFSIPTHLLSTILGERKQLYERDLKLLTMTFAKGVGGTTKDALGQRVADHSIEVSATAFDRMAKQDKTAAFYELEATILHEMAHDEQLAGAEALVRVTQGKKRGQDTYSTGDVGERSRAWFGGLQSGNIAAKENVEKEPFAYYIEGKAFLDVINVRRKLKEFKQAETFSDVYLAYYSNPQFFWDQAVWLSTADEPGWRLVEPTPNQLKNTKF